MNRTRTFLFAYAFAICSSVMIGQISMAADLDLPTITDAIRHYHTSIMAFEGVLNKRYESRLVKTENLSNVVHLNDLRMDIKFLFSRDNCRLFLNVDQSWVFNKISATSRFHRRSLEAFDGTAASFLFFTKSASALPTEVPLDQPFTLNMVNRDAVVTHGPWDLSGLRTKFRTASLSEVLASSKVQLLKSEPIDGVLCYHLTVPVAGFQYDVWVDPVHEFLPRLQQYRKPGAANASTSIRTTEFQKFDDPFHGDQRWIPISGSIESSISIEYLTVSSLRLLDEVPIDRFQIDPGSLPPNVQVNDLTGERWYTGGKPDEWLRIDTLITRESAIIDKLLGKTVTTTHTRNIPSKSRSATDYFNIAVMLVSMICLFLGTYGVICRRHRLPSKLR